MENKNAAVGLDAFERGSQKLLMDIAMESSTRELQQLVGRRQETRKPARLLPQPANLAQASAA